MDNRKALVTVIFSVVCGVKFIVLATGTKVLVFKLGRRRWIFKGDKNP
jgi:hypothetical protein